MLEIQQEQDKALILMEFTYQWENKGRNEISKANSVLHNHKYYVEKIKGGERERESHYYIDREVGI